MDGTEPWELGIEAQFSENRQRSGQDEWNGFDPYGMAVLKERSTQTRSNWMAIITHMLAVMIVGTFLLMTLYGAIFSEGRNIVPPEFLSIASVVIGFYFGKRLAQND